MAFKVFLDTNIFLDHFLQRNAYSSKALALCENGKIQGCASSASFYTLAYLLEKHLSRKEARDILAQYTNFITIIPTTKENLTQAFASNFADLEDAFQYFTALHYARIAYFLTHNSKDFKVAIPSLPVVSPEELLNTHFQ